MTFHFSVEYKTQWGEELRVIIGDKEHALSTFDGTRWEGDVKMSAAAAGPALTYRYALYRHGRLVWTEWEVAPHTVRLGGRKANRTVGADEESYVLTDYWRPIPCDLPLYSTAITECVAPHGQPDAAPMPSFNKTLQLRLVEPRLPAHERLAVCGNHPQLGNWETPVPLRLVALQEWGLNLDATQFYRPIEYKYVIIDCDGRAVQWESGPNRRIPSLTLEQGQTWVKTDPDAHFAINKWKCAGVVVPVFSLRSEQSFGIGDFGDLRRLAGWAQKAGMHAIQILPVNDTTTSHTWQDSYPYNAISIYALHPVYCDIAALPRLDDRLQMEKFLMRQQELNAQPALDYEGAARLKRQYLALAYEQEGADVLASAGYAAWFAANRDWLVPYAAFCHLRDTFGTADFTAWPRHSKFRRDDIERLCAPESDCHHAVALHYYVQYELHLQLAAARDAARRSGVILKGDIPIGISRTSVEAWSEPELFNLDSQAGAPPDEFSTNGQNWGFPTYNWKNILRDGCAWWARRFQKMAEYFDAYRIDHILGFFRIWDIPLHSVHGLLGQFAPSLPMSKSEIESYGLQFDRERMTRPYISDDVLYQIFGYRAELVKTLYLNSAAADHARYAAHSAVFAPFNAFGGVNGLYELTEEYSTQRKIQRAFAGKTSKDDIAMRDGLYALASNVLFVVDRTNPQMYHPRITAQHDLAFRSLSDEQKSAFNRLYDDYYYHRHNRFWYDEAMRKLPRLTQATRMLVCAEDLGMVPESVPWVMEQLRILSLEIQTMPKAYGAEFGSLPDNPYRSVSTISTHDMPTLRQWWEEDPGRAQRFYNHALGIDGQAPSALPGWLAEEIVNRHLYSPSMLCLLSLQDWLSIDERLRNPDAAAERINIPANPRHYWRWRMHLTLEQLEQSAQFNDHVREMIRRAGR